ncbi:unnamed protein product [Chilo suppressalis]|uniref:PHD-type domain-containing protein n=1 Tax=Chilo suppressalis TaxID=168631 RepID=A0ABN8BE45_CHISP|nr:unnamed protein product [Chilo suppressalis]
MLHKTKLSGGETEFAGFASHLIMRTAGFEMTESPRPKKYTCGECSATYDDYKDMVCHLFWRHGTESISCYKCNVRRWQFAVHICHVLPYDEIMVGEWAAESATSSRESYCYCGKDDRDSPMIGCDGDECRYQWYHYACVGMTEAPDGNWLCPTCTK